ncbi:pyridoxamine 5'-phosphate oxidase [Enemella dayhoffiae]|uniref:Pyridoxamine 5'-phosphate oxidase n=2 Tax=Enemella dayhoffiae TaxID=2016507 RepID=A0A255GVS5_9ACTN|nr:pyridoxamine 5'-phosphate oxidase [Enemella dayhoffiae]
MNDPVQELDESECWRLLGSQQVGRLATGAQPRPEIFPVNFVLDEGSIVFRTAPGNKLITLVINNQVAFEVDEYAAEASGWSVVCHGRAAIVEDAERIDRIAGLGLQPWVSTIKTHYVAIEVDEITGRRFNFGEQPEIEG